MLPAAIRRLPIEIEIDTREQLPYQFQNVRTESPIILRRRKLIAGDYSIGGFSDPGSGSAILIERKSMADAFGTFGRGRKRFRRVLEELSRCKYAAVVIEGDWRDFIERPPQYSQFTLSMFAASVNAWSQRFGIHFWLCPGRDFAEQLTFKLLERFALDMRREKANVE